MAIGNMLKSALFKPDEEETPPLHTEPVTPAPRRVISSSRTRPTILRPSTIPSTPADEIGLGRFQRPPVRATAVVNNPDPEMTKDIEVVLGSCRGKGYAELQLQLDALAAHIPDESLRLSAALASLQAMGIPATQVRAAVQERIDVLTKHLGDFTTGLQSEVAATKQQNEVHLASVRGKIRELSAELARLQSEETDASKVLDEIAERSAEVSDRLNATLQPYFDELNGLISRIR